MSRSFRGGIRLPASTIAAGKSIEPAHIPAAVTILLHQYIGAPCEPLVHEGDAVKAGQKIGDSTAFLAAPVHASISGVVTTIGPEPSMSTREAYGIRIAADGRDDRVFMEKIDPASTSKHVILGRLREAGLVDLGGAALPSSVKLTPPDGNEVDTVILNGAECEPGLSADHQLMVEEPDKILQGMKVILSLLDAERGIIGIVDDKTGALERMRGVVERAGEGRLRIAALKPKYPQGEEKILVKTLLNREIPSGGSSCDIGVVVQTVSTAKAVYDAVYEGMPLIERVVSVSGDVKEPKNLRARIGTSFHELIEECGGPLGEVGKVLHGGPMRGMVEYLEFPVVKATRSIHVIERERSRLPEEQECTRCGLCVDTCPISLMPTMLGKLVRAKRFKDCRAYHIFDCMECGSCAYVCPSKIPLLQLIQYGKEEVERRRV